MNGLECRHLRVAGPCEQQVVENSDADDVTTRLMKLESLHQGQSAYAVDPRETAATGVKFPSGDPHGEDGPIETLEHCFAGEIVKPPYAHGTVGRRGEEAPLCYGHRQHGLPPVPREHVLRGDVDKPAVVRNHNRLLKGGPARHPGLLQPLDRPRHRVGQAIERALGAEAPAGADDVEAAGDLLLAGQLLAAPAYGSHHDIDHVPLFPHDDHHAVARHLNPIGAGRRDWLTGHHCNA
mmetsp:Transcript_59947/g.190419  ORF Transcript_59947/g.190419 Transcript_59947/m.190419 type:complete len:237 (-) Transcript_59947:859-1569(-)